MYLQDEISIDKVFIQHIYDEELKKSQLQLDVLRLDLIHPIISGNKWFKLKYYLDEAINNDCKTVATFGGAYSNHLLATAFACHQQKINCIGFIRGEEPGQYSKTLLDAKALNMQLKFLSRAEYANRQSIIESNTNIFFIPVGGYGEAGAKGATEILQLVPEISSYNYIVCAVGTGTMFAGIINASLSNQKCIGISVMKNNLSLENEIQFLTTTTKNFQLLHDYHFGGYAKHDASLIDFMNTIWLQHKLPLDFVYTAKALFATFHLAKQNKFQKGSKILFIHSGGLQGNRSLPAGLLKQPIIYNDGKYFE